MKKKWTAEEDAIILKLHNKYGNKWSFISTYIPGRSDNAIKNRFNGCIKRKLDLQLINSHFEKTFL